MIGSDTLPTPLPESTESTSASRSTGKRHLGVDEIAVRVLVYALILVGVSVVMVSLL